jgi:hypothetical protein
MPVEQALIDSRFNVWIVRLRLDFIDYAAQFESVPARCWFQDVTR